MAEDIISTLPDPIICHILSFLSTEESVATSILSKRWNHLWLSLPVLDFTNLVIEGSDANFRFNDFVYSVLFSRDPALPIKTFRFDVHYQYNDRTNILRIPSFTKWINFVLQHGVECLDLRLHGWDVESCCLPKLPITIFTCSTLVVLKLGLFEVKHSFSSVELPLLKTLHLQSITFPEDQDLRLLLGGCPILEELVISQTYYESEVDSLSCDKWKNFRLSNLKQADVDSSYLHFPFQALQNVNSLCIEIPQEYCCNDAVPIFHNLTRLDLTFLNYRWHILIDVLKHCPRLQYLSLNETETKETTTGIDDQENWAEPDFVLPCLLLHLKTCNLLGFLGLPDDELFLAKYILKNARVLQTMKIWTIGQLKTKRLLSSCPRASLTCKLTFHRDPCEELEEM